MVIPELGCRIKAGQMTNASVLCSIPCSLSPLQSACTVPFADIRPICDGDPDVMAQQAALAASGILQNLTLAHFFASYFCIPPV